MTTTEGMMNTDLIERPAEMATELAPPRDTAVMPGFGSQSSWELANRIGKAFAASTIVPEAYRGNVANCIVALEMANRIGASPMMVMQNLYIVHGNPGWSSKFLIACFNQCGRYSALRYEWEGERGKKNWGCRAWAIEKATGERLVGATVTIEMADAEDWSSKKGSKWKTMPEQMLMYRSAAFMIRTYAPEISMGLRTDDEIIDIEPATDSAPAPRLAKPAEIGALLGMKPPAPDAATGEVPPPATPGRNYAQLAEAMNKATDFDAAALVLDEGRGLPEDQYTDLVAIYTRRFKD